MRITRRGTLAGIAGLAGLGAALEYFTPTEYELSGLSVTDATTDAVAIDVDLIDETVQLTSPAMFELGVTNLTESTLTCRNHGLAPFGVPTLQGAPRGLAWGALHHEDYAETNLITEVGGSTGMRGHVVGGNYHVDTETEVTVSIPAGETVLERYTLDRFDVESGVERVEVAGGTGPLVEYSSDGDEWRGLEPTISLDFTERPLLDW